MTGAKLELLCFLVMSVQIIFTRKILFTNRTGATHLTISRKETLISFSKAVNIFVLKSVMDVTKLESADAVVVGSMISNIVGPGNTG